MAVAILVFKGTGRAEPGMSVPWGVAVRHHKAPGPGLQGPSAAPAPRLPRALSMCCICSTGVSKDPGPAQEASGQMELTPGREPAWEGPEAGSPRLPSSSHPLGLRANSGTRFSERKGCRGPGKVELVLQG